MGSPSQPYAPLLRSLIEFKEALIAGTGSKDVENLLTMKHGSPTLPLALLGSKEVLVAGLGNNNAAKKCIHSSASDV